jgi:S-DNA-T family DNA segregation ATPase FtsK/SpoIIIE
VQRAEVSVLSDYDAEPKPPLLLGAQEPEQEAAESSGKRAARSPEATASAQPISPFSGGASLPPIEIFSPAPKGPSTPLDLEHKAQRIQETLASFKVGARVVGHHCGPVVTQFDIQPDRGVKVRRITELQNDLALALAAPTIRIQAPVPGKPFVGIEIPNSAASMVALRELLESEAYRSLSSPLKVALGKDVAGNPAIIDLARMPHLLIAGATGSGKSVCVNAIISCLLYQNLPDQVRLMMVDPKMVELTVYNGVPHLLSPVITHMDRVVGVLQWALREMERRYQLFADNTVRNIQRYNEKMEGTGRPRLPSIVLIVDELADLMMVSPEDVEDAICRLAQLARAAGIHLVIATQRPSVDVVTGLIKANFPARIAFAMTSQVDSRTILDTAGAEKLLGRGDMLYQAPDAPKPARLQGAHVSDKEIERLVEFWQTSPLQQLVHRVPEEEFAAAEKAASEAGDDLLDEATQVVREYQHASVSLLQRRLRVGYARAARLMDQLEERGVVGAADGSKQRPVLHDDHPFEA